MYYINLTEILRERHLALLKEAEDRRLARRVRVPRARSRKAAAAMGVLAALVAAGIVLVGFSNPAHASTSFTVNNTTDASNVCDASGCSLREAITAADSTPNSGGPDLIHFDISGTGVHTITPGSELPGITEAVVIDGYTQPGSSPNTLAKGTNAKPKIELVGTSAGASTTGLASTPRT